MAATPEVKEVLQEIRINAIQLLDGVEPRTDWSWLVTRTVITLGIHPLVDLIAKLVGSNRVTLWEQCHRREVRGKIGIGEETTDGVVRSWGGVPPARAKEIIVAPDTGIGTEYLCLEQDGGAVLEKDVALGRGAVMGGIKLGRPNLTKAEYYKGIVEQMRQLQAA